MYFEIVDKEKIAKVEALVEKRQEAVKRFLRLSRRVGASRTKYASGDGFGSRNFAFIFTKEPDKTHWKRDRSGDFWLPKYSSKVGKAIADEVHAIENADGSRCEISQIFGVDVFHHVGLEKLGRRWIVVFGDDWKFSDAGLKRISDVEVERLRKKK